MASKSEESLKLNSIRTVLLVMANSELSIMKKNNKTKINSKKLQEAEAFYNSACNYIVELKEENFIPNNKTNDVIQNNHMRKKFTLQSPDYQEINFIRKIQFSDKNIPKINIKNSEGLNFYDLHADLQFDMDVLNKKSDISSKKNMYFKMNTLNINHNFQDLIKYSSQDLNGILNKKKIEQKLLKTVSNFKPLVDRNIEYINIDDGNLTNMKTKMRTQSGFSYLQNLAKDLKILPKKKKKNKYNFDEMTKAIIPKEVNEENVEETESKKYMSPEKEVNLIDVKKNSSFLEKTNELRIISEQKRNVSPSNLDFPSNFTLKLITGNDIEEKEVKKYKSERKISHFEKSIRRMSSINKKNFVDVKDKDSIIILNECENNLNECKEFSHEKANFLHSQEIKIKKTNSVKKIGSMKNKPNTLLCSESSNLDNSNNASHSDKFINFSNTSESNIIFVKQKDSFKNNSFVIQLKHFEDEKSKSNNSNGIINDSYFNDKDDSRILSNDLECKEIIQNHLKKTKSNKSFNNHNTIIIEKNTIEKKNSYKDDKPFYNNTESTEERNKNKNSNDRKKCIGKGSKGFFPAKNSIKIPKLFEKGTNIKDLFRKNLSGKEKKLNNLQTDKISYNAKNITAGNLSENNYNSSYLQVTDQSDYISDNQESDNEIYYYEKTEPLTERPLFPNKFFKIKEIDFLNSVNLRKKIGKAKEENRTIYANNHMNVQSTDTSSFIQLKKIQNEEKEFSRSKSKERIILKTENQLDSEKSIHSINSEIENIEINKCEEEKIDKSFNFTNIDITNINDTNEIIKLKKLPRCSDMDIKEIIQPNRKSRNDLIILKLQKCKSVEDNIYFEDEISENNDNILSDNSGEIEDLNEDENQDDDKDKSKNKNKIFAEKKNDENFDGNFKKNEKSRNSLGYDGISQKDKKFTNLFDENLSKNENKNFKKIEKINSNIPESKKLKNSNMMNQYNKFGRHSNSLYLKNNIFPKGFLFNEHTFKNENSVIPISDKDKNIEKIKNILKNEYITKKNERFTTDKKHIKDIPQEKKNRKREINNQIYSSEQDSSYECKRYNAYITYDFSSESKLDTIDECYNKQRSINLPEYLPKNEKFSKFLSPNLNSRKICSLSQKFDEFNTNEKVFYRMNTLNDRNLLNNENISIENDEEQKNLNNSFKSTKEKIDFKIKLHECKTSLKKFDSNPLRKIKRKKIIQQ